MTNRKFTENIEVAGDKLVSTVKGLYQDASVRRITVRTRDGRKLFSTPMTWGVAGGAAALVIAPWLTVLAAIGGAFARLKVEVERTR